MATKPAKKYWLTALLIISLLAIFLYTSYNSLVKKQEAVIKAWNNLQSDYQRRGDLIPNLVGTVKASSDYEKETLTRLMDARARVSKINTGNPPAYNDFVQSENVQNDMVNAANRVIGVIEKYPDLKSTNAFVRLQDQLIGTERRIKFSRKDFNDAVMIYNKTVRSFPSSIAASLFGYKVKEGFTVDAGTQTAPEINFNK